MRKIFANLKSVVALAVVAAMTLSVSCMYDDTALTKRVDKVEKDLAALTEKVNALENQSLTDLLAGNLVITNVATDDAGNTVLKLSNGEEVTVLAGADTLQYRTENGVLEISADGETWVAVATPAECVVKEVVVNEDGSVTIILADGTEATVGVAELIECEATRSAVYVVSGAPKAVRFSINDAVEDINVMNQPFGWSATVEEYVPAEDPGYGGGVMPLAAGGKDYVLNINAPAAELVQAGYAAKEGVISVHFNTAAGACKVMNVNVTLAEITMSVDAAGNLTITNSIAMEQADHWGDLFTDFADFWIGVMPKALYDAHGADALKNDYAGWGEYYESYVTQRGTGLSNVTDLLPYEENVYEKEVINLTVDALGQAFWPSFTPQIGGEYVIFLTLDSEMMDYYEVPVLTNAITVEYKKTLVNATLVEGSEKWNDATFTFNLAGYDNFVIGWMSAADLDMYMYEYGMGNSLEEIVPQIMGAYGVMSSGAILAGSHIDETLNLSDLAALSLQQWAPTLSAGTEYYLYLYPFNASTEMEFYTHAVVAENIVYAGTFETAALQAGSFDAGFAFEVKSHEKKEIYVDVTVDAANVITVAYNWYEEPFIDAEQALAAMLADEYGTEFVAVDAENATFEASSYEYYGLADPIYLAAVAINANGEYVFVQQEFKYVEPVLPVVAITSFEYLGRQYDLDEDESTAGGDFVYALTCEDGTEYTIGFYYTFANADGSLIEGTYNYCYNYLGAMYSSWAGFVVVSDTYYYDSTITVTAETITWKIPGVVDYVYTKGGAVEPEPEPEPEDLNLTFTSGDVLVPSGYSDFYVNLYGDNGLQMCLNFWYICDNNFIPEGTYHIGNIQGSCIYTETYSWVIIDGEKYDLYGGEVYITEVDEQYEFTFTNVYYGSDFKIFNATFKGAIEGLVVPSAYEEPVASGDTVELQMYDWTKTFGTWGVSSEYEICWFFDDGYSVVLDFNVNPIVAGTYTLDSGLVSTYCKFRGTMMINCEVQVVDAGDGQLGFDVNFTSMYGGEIKAYHFTWVGDPAALSL